MTGRKLWHRARKAAGLEPTDTDTHDVLRQPPEENAMSDDLRLKLRYLYVCGVLDTNPDKRHLWEKRRHELEEELMQHDIRPSTLLD